jgi:N-acyl homoserine lactone hydrolase
VINATPKRLYVMQLSTTTLPLPSGQTLFMSNGCYLVQTNDGKNILIDTGLPPEYTPPPGTPPAENTRSVLEHLTDLGVHPGDISLVICTHFDVDHAGYHDAFTKAEFVAQRIHYTLARSGEFPRFEGARPHWDQPALRYRLIDGDIELLPGLMLLETSGHAPGHQSVLVRLPHTGPVLLAIDAVVLQRLFTPERRAWPTDDNEEELRASTEKLLDLVKREQIALVVCGHDGEQWRTLKKSPEFYD